MNQPLPNDQQLRQPQELSPKGVRKIRTMIEGLDEITHGGLPLGRTTLASGTSGTGKTLLAKALAHETNSTFIELVGSELVQNPQRRQRYAEAVFLLLAPYRSVDRERRHQPLGRLGHPTWRAIL